MDKVALPLAARKLQSIQLLRGIAAVLVVLHHATETAKRPDALDHEFLSGFFSFGYAGVDFFFVLSGFIITFIHAGDVGRPEKLRSYATKRFLRIYPIYWVVLLALIPLFFLFRNAGFGHETRPDVLFTSIFLLPHTLSPVLTPAWTLRHEVWFYLLFGLLIFLRRPYGIILMLAVAAASFLVWALSLAGWIGTLPFPLDFLLSHYNLEFALGAVCALVFLRGKSAVSEATAISAAPILLTGLAGLVLFTATALYDLRVSTLAGSLLSLPSYAAASTLILFGAVSLEAKYDFRLPGFTQYLGEASYSIYLIHTPAIAFGEKALRKMPAIAGLHPNFAILATIVLSVAAGLCLHAWIEKPLLRRFHARRKEVG
jgi:exopolysaccharide production protein ExoZ